jgi:hypothetical protein
MGGFYFRKKLFLFFIEQLLQEFVFFFFGLEHPFVKLHYFFNRIECIGRIDIGVRNGSIMQGAGYDIYYPDYDGVPGYFEIPAGIFIFTCGLWQQQTGHEGLPPGAVLSLTRQYRAEPDIGHDHADGPATLVQRRVQ